MAAAVVLGRDLDVPIVDVAIHVLVLDAHVREVDLVVVVRQVMLASPFLDFVGASIRSSVAVPIPPIAILEEALVLALQLAVELHANDAGVLIS